MKSKIQPTFNQWLELMEEAFEQLNLEEFRQLEDKIIEEIAARRRNQGKKK